jgi:pimeloyl-ACP methyl ester carboxylesterase
MTMPQTRYARSGDVMIAYQVLGEGPSDVVYVPGSISHVELQWDAAGLAALLRGLAEHARVLVFDKRGTGMSDRVAGAPTLEERSDDIRAVMDAARSDRAALFGVSEGVPMSVIFAASHPERVTASGSSTGATLPSTFPARCTRDWMARSTFPVGGSGPGARLADGERPGRRFRNHLRRLRRARTEGRAGGMAPVLCRSPLALQADPDVTLDDGNRPRARRAPRPEVN